MEGYTKNVMSMEPVNKKFEAVGWALNVRNGHDFRALQEAFECARSTPDVPTIIIAEMIV